MSLRNWIIFWTLCIVWGVPYFLIKLALVDLSPACVAFGRILLGALVLAPIAWHRGVLLPALRHKGAILAFAVAELAIPFSLISLGESWVSSSMAGVLIATVPLMVLIVAPLFGVKEHMSRRRVLGLGIGFVGVVVLLGLDTISTAEQWAGVACLGGAVAGYAVGPLIVQRYLSEVDELGAVAASLMVASILLLPTAVMTAPTTMPSTMSLVSVGILGLLCTAAALLMFFYLINAAGAARTTVVAYVNPAIAALLGILVLNERFGLGLVLGLAMILLGSWLGTREGRSVGMEAAAAEKA